MEKKMELKKNNYLTKQKILQILSKKTGISKKNVNLLFEELLNVISEHMNEKNSDKFIFPGIFKITTKLVKEQKEKIGINPFTKKEMVFKYKPATKKIKIKILKNLKNLLK